LPCQSPAIPTTPPRGSSVSIRSPSRAVSCVRQAQVGEASRVGLYVQHDLVLGFAPARKAPSRVCEEVRHQRPPVIRWIAEIVEQRRHHVYGGDPGGSTLTRATPPTDGHWSIDQIRSNRP